jgi:hypothetical protein
MPELCTMDELRERGQVIYYHNKGAILYPDPGKKCPYPNCNCRVNSNVSMQQHLQAHRRPQKHGKRNVTQNLDPRDLDTLSWTPFNRGDGAWIFRNEAPALTKTLELRGEVIIGKFKYKLSGEKFIVRNPI